MPKRFIKDSCRTSKTLDRLSPEAERLFWRLVTVADDFGRFDAEISLVASSCFPLRNGTLKLEHVRKWVAELHKFEHIKLYSNKSYLFGYFTNWEQHQGKPRAEKSKFPDPLHADACKGTQPHADSLVSVSESESDIRIRYPNPTYVSARKCVQGGFDGFWQLYPKKRSKGEAEKVWKSLKPDEQLQAKIAATLTQAITSVEWTKDGGRYIPHPATWLRAQGWEDEPTQAVDPLAAQVKFLLGKT